MTPWRYLIRVATYRGHEGQLAWVLHRLTGLGVVVFLSLHIFDIWLVGAGRETFNRFLFLYRSPLAVGLEVGLLFGVLYHALNGLRLSIVDLWPGMARHQRIFFRLAALLLIVVLTPAVWVTIRGLF